MTTRRKTKPRAYDYMEGLRIAREVLAAAGEPLTLTPTENDALDVAVEVAADIGLPPEQAAEMVRETTKQIISERGRVLFPVFDERDPMGDETINPRDAEIAA